MKQVKANLSTPQPRPVKREYNNSNALLPFVVIMLLQSIGILIGGIIINKLSESRELIFDNHKIVMEITSQRDIRTKKLEDALDRVQYKLQSLDAKTEALENAKQAPR